MLMTDIVGIVLNFAERATSTTTMAAQSNVKIAEGAEKFSVALMAIGLCVLAVWVIRHVADSRKFMLTKTPGRPNDLTVVHVLILLLVCMLVGYVGVALALLLLGQGFSEPIGVEARLLGASIGGLLLLGVLMGMAHTVFHHGITRGMGLSTRRWFVDSARGLLGVLAVYPVCVGLLLLSTHIVPEALQQRHVVLIYIAGADISAGWKLLAVIVAFAVAPLVEEVLFRGMFQSALRQWLGSPWIAIVICSALFAAVHITTQKGPPHLVGFENLPPLFALSIVLGYTYERTGRLLPSIIIHMLFNGISLATVLWPG